MNKILSGVLTLIISLAACYSLSFGNETRKPDALDLSFVGTMLASYSDIEGIAYNKEFLVNELEFVYEGYLYPGLKTYVITALHRHEAAYNLELEEAYLQFLELELPSIGVSLPNTGLVLGKRLVQIGKLNPIHPHQWPFISRPEVLSSFFGEHGLNAEGASISYLLPFPFFSQVEVGYWSVAGALAHEHEHEGEEKEEESTSILGLSGRNILVRSWNSFEIDQNQELEVGLNFLSGHGSHAGEHQDDVTVQGLDLTYRLVGSGSSRLLFLNELYSINRVVPVGEMNKLGLYSLLSYRLNQYWEGGIRFDTVDTPFPESEQRRFLSVALNHYLTEMTRFTGEYRKSLNSSDYALWFQVGFGMGPHSHPLQ